MTSLLGDALLPPEFITNTASPTESADATAQPDIPDKMPEFITNTAEPTETVGATAQPNAPNKAPDGSLFFAICVAVIIVLSALLLIGLQKAKSKNEPAKTNKE